MINIYIFLALGESIYLEMSAEEKGKKVGKPAASSEKTDDKKGKPPVWRIIEPKGANI